MEVRLGRAVLVAVVAVGVTLAGLGLAVWWSASSPSPSACDPFGPPPRPQQVELTTGQNYFGFGREYALEIPFAIPSRANELCFFGSFSAISASGGFNGTANQTVNCTTPHPECDSFVGVWTASAWTSFVGGSAATPIWCYAEQAGTCGFQSSGNFSVGGLAMHGATSLLYAMWTNGTWDPYGKYAFSAYVVLS
jgi:hypothetical protein